MWSTADRTLGSIEESGSSFEAVSPEFGEQSVFGIASRHETRAVMKGAPASGRRIDKFARGSVERSVSVPPWARRSPICEPESWVMMPKKVRNVKRAEWKRDDPVEYGEQEPRRQFWLHVKAAPTVARMMAPGGYSMFSPRLAQGRFGDTRATQTAPSKMEVQSRHATAAVVNRVKHQQLGLMLDDGNDAAGKAFLVLVVLQRN